MTQQISHPRTGMEMAKSFRERYQGKGWLSDQKIEEICTSLAAVGTDSESARGKLNIVSAIFYVNVIMNLYDSPGNKDTYYGHFVGHCGGWMAPGDSFFDPFELKPCSPYTLNDVFTRSSIIEVNSAAIFCEILFFDSQKNLLGTLQGAGAGTAIGVAAGTGQWGPGWWG